MSFLCWCLKAEETPDEQKADIELLNSKTRKLSQACDTILKQGTTLSDRDLNTLQLYSQLQTLPPQLTEVSYGRECLAAHGDTDKITAMDIFDFLEIIGSGVTSIVFRAVFKPENCIKAVKYIPDFKQYKLNILNEIFVLKYCQNCRYTLNYHSHFRVDRHLYVVTDLYPAGSLDALIYPAMILPKNLVRIYIKDVANALFFLHKAKIVHRDVTPKNIVLGNNGHLRLIDFSCAKVMTGKTIDSDRFTNQGSPAYRAPEIYLNKICNHSVDWWSVGVMLYRLTTGSTPFINSDTQAKLMTSFQSVTKLNPKYPRWAFKDQDLLHLCSHFLKKKPIERLGNTREQKSIKSHPYFDSINWDEVEDLARVIELRELDRFPILLKLLATQEKENENR